MQLKGTAGAANADGSVSVAVERTNLNYLLSPSDSLYVCHHVPTGRTLVRSADSVYADYERRGGPPWKDQETITVRFVDPFDEEFQRRWQRLALARNRDASAERLAWAEVPPDRMFDATSSHLPRVSIPSSMADAATLLRTLYEKGEDRTISRSFEQFHALLDADLSSLDLLYMAETNVGLNSKDADPKRMQEAIEHFKRRQPLRPPSSRASISYSLGNAYLAIGICEEAVTHFESALATILPSELKTVGAPCWKNLGSALEKMERWEEARTSFERALELDPDLDEANFALGLWHLRQPPDLLRALDHFDRVSSGPGSVTPQRPVIGWKADVLFRLGRVDEAFAAVDTVLSAERLGSWEWPWCARLVREHGKRSTAAAGRALRFWRRFLKVHPNDRWALAEEFTCIWALHQDGVACGVDLETFRTKGSDLLRSPGVDAGVIWDRIGHWAQTDDDWDTAEKAFRMGYELDPGRYAYCLGTALNHLDRWKDALEVLLNGLTTDPSDALSWFQVGVARDKLGDGMGAVEGFKRAIDLDPLYAKAYFNLGGILWNAGVRKAAVIIWRDAIRRFPDDSNSLKLLDDLPFLRDEPEPEPSRG